MAKKQIPQTSETVTPEEILLNEAQRDGDVLKLTTEYADAFPLYSIWQFDQSKFMVVSMRATWKGDKVDIEFVRVM